MMVKQRDKLLKFLNTISMLAMGMSLCGIVACIILQIVSRYLFKTPLSWTEEISLFAFCWLTYTGSASVSCEDSHLKVEFLYSRFSRRLRRILDAAIQLLTMATSIAVAVVGLKTMIRQKGISTVASGIPVWLYTMAIFLGFSAIAAFSFGHAAASLGRLRKHGTSGNDR